ncbi:MAG: transglutaminase-like cysteine peptidase [Gammaproteobacteria bacterium]
MRNSLKYLRRLIVSLVLLPCTISANFPSSLFGFQQEQQTDISVFLQWVRVLENHIKLDTPEGNCDEKSFNRCHLRNWQAFLGEIRQLPLKQQLTQVNRYANSKKYILDMDNYGMSDYWAVAREFLYNGGDCEDYAIIKLFSLRWLGFSVESTRIVILQDTNLRVAHAVLAVENKGDIMILDNQIEEVVSHKEIVHYSPVYSINENNWWLHLPN